MTTVADGAPEQHVPVEPGTRPAVQRLGGFDAIFVHLETPAVHQHILLTYLLEPHPDLTFENVVASAVDHLDLLPPLRRRTVRVPFALNHPVWVAQPEIDTTHHFRRTDLGGAGTRRDLDAVMGTVASSVLDPAHPLWEMHYVEGLEDGGVALVVKIHHSLADGSVVTALVENVAALPEGAVRPPLPQQLTTTALPGRGRLVLDGLRDLLLALSGIPALLVRTVRGLAAASAYKRRHRATMPVPVLHSPKVSFHGTLTPRRQIVTTDIEMSRIKEIRTQHQGATVNDVLLGMISGALRRWLEAHGEHPRRSLVASIPVGADLPGAERRLVGNNLSNLTTTLATHIDDPTERLRAISVSMKHAKKINHLLGPENLEGWLRVSPGGLIRVIGRVLTALRLPDVLPPPFTLQVSNTPGPRIPVQVGPVRLRSVRTTGPLLQGNGLGVIAYSYTDRMNVTLYACPDLLDDVDVLAGYLPLALDDYDLAGS